MDIREGQISRLHSIKCHVRYGMSCVGQKGSMFFQCYSMESTVSIQFFFNAYLLVIGAGITD